MEKKSAVESLFARTAQGIKPGLEVTEALLQALDCPHQQLAVIHVAGTNGKGSVCAMLESVLRASGFRTGLYTSPHLIDFSERFRINGEPISKQKLDHYIRVVEAASETLTERQATFFEVSTALAFRYFMEESVDVAVIETGMGGRWDSTNVVIPLLSVITHIDMDHTDFLGDTIEAIAAEKAGIIKPGRPVLSAPQRPEVMAVLRESSEAVVSSEEAVSVARIGAPQKLRIETHSRTLPPINLPLLGECQRENCAVAVAALEVLADMLDFEPAFKEGLEAVEWGARFQMLQAEPPVILDGAHNPSAARALVKTLRETYPGYQVGFVLGFLGDKDCAEFLREIRPLETQTWMVGVDGPRGARADESVVQAQLMGIEAEAATSMAAALESARSWAVGEKRLVCITGSLMLRQMLD